MGGKDRDDFLVGFTSGGRGEDLDGVFPFSRLLNLLLTGASVDLDIQVDFGIGTHPS